MSARYKEVTIKEAREHLFMDLIDRLTSFAISFGACGVSSGGFAYALMLRIIQDQQDMYNTTMVLATGLAALVTGVATAKNMIRMHETLDEYVSDPARYMYERHGKTLLE